MTTEIFKELTGYQRKYSDSLWDRLPEGFIGTISQLRAQQPHLFEEQVGFPDAPFSTQTSRSIDQQNSCRLHVSNMPPGTTRSKLQASIETALGQLGISIMALLNIDMHEKYAFIDFRRPEDVEAILTRSKPILDGQLLVLKRPANFTPGKAGTYTLSNDQQPQPRQRAIIRGLTVHQIIEVANKHATGLEIRATGPKEVTAFVEHRGGEQGEQQGGLEGEVAGAGGQVVVPAGTRAAQPREGTEVPKWAASMAEHFYKAIGNGIAPKQQTVEALARLCGRAKAVRVFGLIEPFDLVSEQHLVGLRNEILKRCQLLLARGLGDPTLAKLADPGLEQTIMRDFSSILTLDRVVVQKHLLAVDIEVSNNWVKWVLFRLFATMKFRGVPLITSFVTDPIPTTGFVPVSEPEPEAQPEVEAEVEVDEEIFDYL